MQKFQIIFIVLFFASAIYAPSKNEPNYEIAFAKFAPMNTDIFTADADGSNATHRSRRPPRRFLSAGA